SVSTTAGNDTVVVYDVCELATNEVLAGGTGNDTLVVPVSLDEVTAAGVVATGFEQVVVEKQSCLSECGQQPDCSEHGVCVEAPGPGGVACACDPGWAGPNCEIACLDGADCSIEVYPTAIGGVGGMLAHGTALFAVSDVGDPDAVESELRAFLA